MREKPYPSPSFTRERALAPAGRDARTGVAGATSQRHLLQKRWGVRRGLHRHNPRAMAPLPAAMDGAPKEEAGPETGPAGWLLERRCREAIGVGFDSPSRRSYSRSARVPRASRRRPPCARSLATPSAGKGFQELKCEPREGLLTGEIIHANGDGS